MRQSSVEKSKPILPSSVSPSPATQQEGRAQKIYQAQQKWVLVPEELKVENGAIPKTPALEILEASIGTGIERDGGQQFLTGTCSDFKSDNQRGYFFTRIKTPRVGRVAHIWILEGKEHHRMEMEVKPPAWSVYSYFTFRPEHSGNWKAEVRDGDRVLTSLNFRVTQSSGDRSL